MGDTYDEDKRLIRGQIRARRTALSPGEVARLSAAACARLLVSPLFARARHVAAYAAIDNELDPALLVEAAFSAGRRVYLPVVSRERFDFVGLSPPRPGHGKSGAVGPRGAPCLPPEAEDVVFLVPGVAFTPCGVRLGRGAGHGGSHPGGSAQGRRGDPQRGAGPGKRSPRPGQGRVGARGAGSPW